MSAGVVDTDAQIVQPMRERIRGILAKGFKHGAAATQPRGPLTMTDNLTMTLARIRDEGPCLSGCETLLASLEGACTPLTTLVSLGDIARSNGAADAYWCVRALDWSDARLRRRVIAVLLLSVRRAAGHTTDQQVSAGIVALQRWCDGDDSVDLLKASRDAWREGAGWAVSWAAEAARERRAIWAAATARMTVASVAKAAMAVSWAAGVAELGQQQADLVAAFPPLHEGGAS